MNKNATLMSHLQNAAIAVLTVTAVLLLIQTPLVGDLAGKTPYELAQDWLAGDTSTDTAVTTDLTELALPVRVTGSAPSRRLTQILSSPARFSARRLALLPLMKRAAVKSCSPHCTRAASTSIWRPPRRSKCSAAFSASTTRRSPRSCASRGLCSAPRKTAQRSTYRTPIRAFLSAGRR